MVGDFQVAPVSRRRAQLDAARKPIRTAPDSKGRARWMVLRGEDKWRCVTVDLHRLRSVQVYEHVDGYKLRGTATIRLVYEGGLVVRYWSLTDFEMMQEVTPHLWAATFEDIINEWHKLGAARLSRSLA